MNKLVLTIQERDDENGFIVVLSDKSNEHDSSIWSKLWMLDEDKTIRSLSTGMVLTTTNISHDGTLFLWSKNDKLHQKWWLKDVYINSVTINKTFDVGLLNEKNGARVIAWDFHGGLNQQWEVSRKYCE